jgi:hypothetical protein
MNDPARAALSYAAAGWQVIPLHSIRDGACTCGKADCARPGKHPRTKNGLKDGTTDSTVIERWWRQWANANIGVTTGAVSGIVALDIDPRHSGDESLKAFIHEHGELPATVEAVTGGGGAHLFFMHPGGTVKNRTGLLLGIDVRGDGGYIVAPPSAHISGGQYRWRDGHAPLQIKVAAIPPALLELLAAEQVPQANRILAPPSSTGVARLIQAAQRYAAQCEPASEGARNNAAFHIAGHLFALVTDDSERLTEEQVLNLLRPWNDRNAPPLLEAELKQSIRSASVNGTPRASKLVRTTSRRPATEVIEIGNGKADDVANPSTEKWPRPLGADAFYGLAGELVQLIEPHSEADPAALLVQTLVAFGNVIGRSAYFRVEGDRHFVNVFIVLVGRTAKGRKGTSWGHINGVFSEVDPTWARDRIMGGLSSGEGLIWHVRDAVWKQEPVREKGKANGRVVAYQNVQTDAGVPDKRLLVMEAEFASALKVASREGNTLSPTIRQAWDVGRLRILNKNSPAQSTNAHISIIGHVTREELRRHLQATEMVNGFANRFLWVCVRRSKTLPEGGNLGPDDLAGVTERITEAVHFARESKEMRRDDGARALWADVYPALSEGRTGLLGAALSRAEAQVLRLSCVYALLDQSTLIRTEHLKAALAVWDYVERSATYIFGAALGDPLADEILRQLIANPQGMSRTAIRDAFSRHKKSGDIDRAIEVLLEEGHAERRQEASGGRPVEMWLARSRCDESDRSDETPRVG